MSATKEHYHNEIEAGMKEKEHPILFSPPMVQAILEGRKTQTRRVFKNVPKTITHIDKYNKNGHWTLWNNKKIDRQVEKCRLGQPGDLLWVREKFAWTVNEHEPIDTLSFFADSFHRDVKRPGVDYPEEEMCLDGWYDPNLSKELKWKPSIYMPKAAARIWLRVKDVRVERVQDISEEDILAEGVRVPVNPKTGGMMLKLGKANSALKFFPKKEIRNCTLYELLFAHWAELWCQVNGRKSWDANPWVWVVEFEELSRTGRPEPKTIES